MTGFIVFVIVVGFVVLAIAYGMAPKGEGSKACPVPSQVTKHGFSTDGLPNPATGLMMNGGLDAGGNPYGVDNERKD